MEALSEATSIQTILLFGLLKVVLVVAVLMPMISYSVMAERRISAAIQDRIGPNRVGPFGLLQPIADGLKSFLKEDFTPNHVRKVYFWLAPAIAMIPPFLTIAIIPFGSTLGGQNMVIANLNVGILFTFSVVSLGGGDHAFELSRGLCPALGDQSELHFVQELLPPLLADLMHLEGDGDAHEAGVGPGFDDGIVLLEESPVDVRLV